MADEVSGNKQVVAALGSVFIPSAPGDPGYKELESHGITDYVIQKLSVADAVDAFNTASKQFFDGKPFLDLDEKQREQYLALIVDGSKIADQGQRTQLQTFYRGVRSRILTVYYKNYPFHEVKRNALGEPILQPRDMHQITNPNIWKDKKLVTGWDIAGYKGPLTWEEEEQLRAKAKKTVDYWYEGDLVKLDHDRPPAAAAIKTSDGHDYYDVIVLGGGTAGCIVAGRLAERGINPKTGDRLKVAMIEGGDDWTIRDPGIKPGYGSPIRRRMVADVPDGIGPDGGGSETPGASYLWPSLQTGGENFRLVGGCSNHYGGICWIPAEEDFHFYREASGVDWDVAKFGDAIQEIRDIYHVSALPDASWSKGDHVWADAGRALGFEMRATEIGRRNFVGIDGDMSRYDSKSTSLPWAYIGLNNGLKVIANAEVQKILIEKVPGGRPVATGAVYTDKAGTMHEVRAARVIVALAANFTPLLLYKSGYGPRELLGDKLLVENKNVGQHLTGDCDLVSSAYLAEPITPEGRDGEICNEGNPLPPWAATTPRPWGELTIHVRAGGVGRMPDGVALGPLAPAFGWEHKEYMRNGSGARHIVTWRTHLGAIPWSWRVLPDTKLERVELDAARVDAKIKEAGEIIRAWHGKLAIKPVKVDLRGFSRAATALSPGHRTGTARAGSSRETSVCTSDFDCHDIDNLLFTSSATIPRTFFWSLGPTAVNAAYSWRRMMANHFSTGSSTKGFA
jgi:choline dehydrogenase-like flavoprotein